MCETDHAKLRSINRRTLDRIARLAHTKTGLCPGCGMTIVDKKVEDFTKEMPLAKHGDKVPDKGNWEGTLEDLGEEGLSWLKIHKGVVYGSLSPLSLCGVCLSLFSKSVSTKQQERISIHNPHNRTCMSVLYASP